MRRTYSTWLLLGVAALTFGIETACLPQARITGSVKITDGDSFEIGATRIRLFGVDAPEGRQPCTRNGGAWRCGEAAASELKRLVGSRDVTCVQRDEDDYGRMVAVCRSGNTDLGAAMVRAGLALAYRQYSNDYVDEESEAHTARRGVWAAEFTPPWEWRRNERAEATSPAAPSPPRNSTDGARPASTQAAPSAGCRIKGNINSSDERIYHVPGSASYDDTRIDQSRGERWFCSEQEARSAGWRAPRGGAI
jgi:endonuclease YncB( thermonuclease family)